MDDYPSLDPYSRSRYDQGIDSKIVIMGNSGIFRVTFPNLRISPSFPTIGVGKTSLLYRYTQNKFDPKNTTSTSGAFFVAKKVYVNGVKVRLQLWDTAGQERFRSMVSFATVDLFGKALNLFWPLQAPMYYRGNDNLSAHAARRQNSLSFCFCFCAGANAALLLYDITNVSTFEDIRGWLQG